MPAFRIAVLPGDGIGPDVTAEGLKTLRAVEAAIPELRFECDEMSVGANEFLRSGNPLPGRPEQEADLRVTLAPWKGAVKLVGSMLYTDEIPVNASGRTTLNDRTTFDLSLRLGLEALSSWPERVGLRELAFSVVATNVTDRAVRDSRGFPQPGRILTFRLDARR